MASPGNDAPGGEGSPTKKQKEQESAPAETSSAVDAIEEARQRISASFNFSHNAFIEDEPVDEADFNDELAVKRLDAQ